MKVRNILSNRTVKSTVIASCAVLLVGLGAFSALEAKATEGKNDNINLEKATTIALEDAKFKDSDVTKVKGSYESDDGKLKYEIKFVADGKEYEYDINGKTGEILDKSVEKIEVNKPVEKKAEVVKPVEQKVEVVKPVKKDPVVEKISASDAKAIALKDANVSSDIRAKVELNEDDGVLYYDVEFISGNNEYDYDINAKTGAILDKSVEREEVEKPQVNKPAAEKPVEKPVEKPAESKISVDEAKAIALKDAKVSNATFVKAELDRDDGLSYYEIEFVSGDYEFEYEINASTGSILDKSVDREDD